MSPKKNQTKEKVKKEKVVKEPVKKEKVVKEPVKKETVKKVVNGAHLSIYTASESIC